MPLPAITTPAASTTIGFCWPKRRRLARIASRFRSGCRRAFAGSACRLATSTRSGMSAGGNRSVVSVIWSSPSPRDEGLSSWCAPMNCRASGSTVPSARQTPLVFRISMCFIARLPRRPPARALHASSAPVSAEVLPGDGEPLRVGVIRGGRVPRHAARSGLTPKQRQRLPRRLQRRGPRADRVHQDGLPPGPTPSSRGRRSASRPGRSGAAPSPSR